VFHMDVYNGYTRMLQASVLNVSSVFSDVCLQVCLSGCCLCFTYMLHVFYLDVVYILKWFFQAFSGIFTCISSVCC
jgi:hypothetical protein